ncbi:transporter substrate-binding domain-containing protein [Terasakiella sp. A23]|uniref:substrate-binding periplasmic protein n=1 Tax=Terasakiella sp. FCG-A23 TaxID=3080561 RepID=UPI0029550716|nr:transporter substrate-binding domain-containing protein [Terasakiella sp. A23]MDV7339834.1 transporter substrate-binding domain-containing protein [Terasakiella sp. A23]
MRVFFRLACFCILFWHTPAHADGLVFYTESYPPYSYQDKTTGKISGIAVDIVDHILKRTGFKTRIQLVPWKRGYETTLSRKNTCLFSTGRTEDREKLFKWVTPFTEVSLVLFSRKDNPVTLNTLDDVRNYRIGGYLGDAASDYLVQKNIAVETVTNDQFNLRKLQSGRIDLWATGELAGLELADAAGIENITKAYTLFSTPGGIACNIHTDDIILERMRDELDTLQKDGVISEIYHRYMPELSVPGT